MSERTTAFIGLGANLGDTAAALRRALDRLGRLEQTLLVRCSSFYRTSPIDARGPDYFNAVAEISTALPPSELLSQLQRLETEEGRQRPYRNAPRTLDLDLLLYGERRIDTPVLTLPHPRMRERAFVLIPLSEIAPGRVSQVDLEAVKEQRVERVTGNGVRFDRPA